MFLESIKNEGALSKQRSIITERKHLNEVGRKIIETKRIKSNLKTIPKNIFGNTLEAIIGAIYINEGIEKTKKFIKKNIINSQLTKNKKTFDSKGQLQTIIQKNKHTIQYKLINEKGPDHNKEFMVGVFVNNGKIAEAKASSIKEAEQKAAQEALKSVS